jgi:hypothetical protein
MFSPCHVKRPIYIGWPHGNIEYGIKTLIQRPNYFYFSFLLTTHNSQVKKDVTPMFFQVNLLDKN